MIDCFFSGVDDDDSAFARTGSPFLSTEISRAEPGYFHGFEHIVVIIQAIGNIRLSPQATDSVKRSLHPVHIFIYMP